MLLAWGRSHRTSTDGELVRWGARPRPGRGPRRPRDDRGRPRPARARRGGGARKRIRVNGVPAGRPGSSGCLRTVVFAPEEMLLVVGSPGLRRAAIDQLATQRSPAYAARPRHVHAGRSSSGTACCGRSARSRRRATSSGSGTTRSSTRGGAIVAERLRLLDDLAGPLARAHAEIAPDEAGAARLAIALRDERAGTPRGVAAGRPRPAPRRDRREGGLERLDARSGRIATTSSSGWTAATWPGSRRAASSGPRSSPSSSPSSTS